ncbi:MAG: hypothetical protein COA47_07455 [Robiginitomaculum sp.]|nr:MAG: hypothetical protein COA47_07455 [Robiginitomaculum sp.]
MRRPKFGLSKKNSRRLKAAGGIGLIVVGIPLIPFPIPIGGIVTVTGLVVLTNNSDAAKRGMEKLKERYPEAPRQYRKFSRKMRDFKPFKRNR